MLSFLRRTWAEIDLDALVHNFNVIKHRAGKSALICVVKADAYGHGVKPIVEKLIGCGANYFAVSNINEALELREIDKNINILILGYTPANDAKIIAENNITQTIFSLDFGKQLSTFAKAAGVSVKIHLKLDTGMSRIGFDCRDDGLCGIDEVLKTLSLENLVFDGVFTHFAASDRDGDEDGTFTNAQYERFCRATKLIENTGHKINMRHCCNSAALFIDGDKHIDACRPGIVLYGLSPAESYISEQSLIPVMTLKSVVAFIKDIKAGASISYGCSYTANKPMRIATIPVGYADGYPRLLSNKGYVLINGKRANILGKVCMDQLCVDITDINGVHEGDEVELFGKNLHVGTLAKLCDTIHYELVCGISKRVERIIKSNEEQ